MGCQMLSCGSTKMARQNEKEKIIPYGSWKRYMAYLEGPQGTGRIEAARSGHMALLGSVGGSVSGVP